MANGDLDPSDFPPDRCLHEVRRRRQGPTNLKAIEEKPPGFIADSI
jgi:hypothetical protein